MEYKPGAMETRFADLIWAHEQFVEETFDGSLPQFLAAFTTRKELSEKDIDELQRFIDKHRR